MDNLRVFFFDFFRKNVYISGFGVYSICKNIDIIVNTGMILEG